MKMVDKPKVHLYGNYYFLRFDDLNLSIVERKIKEKSKEEYFVAKYYYSNVKQASSGIKRMYVQDLLLNSLKNEQVEKLIEDLELLELKIKEYKE